ncbi:molybdopterin-binding protein [Actinoplanes derwentensis]|uniref:Molybdopterin molybdenumtransferase n=1 Tax=Actinoplanes derwentensis TaxID=113562 RepID=A0A1H2DBP1_9ACTN|nr:molybdopterin-binding protein [Actinoplanes derwentensis]GID87520.1 molybdopterin molybdenumtransferase MoeA [Actinoplanes derwentensis]SDT80170.1 molybdopterin molybdotransferase [Actinoplanes derwentensis]
MPWEQAYATARDTPQPLPSEHLAISTATGRVLAAPILARSAAPAFDAAAMDGYAIAGPGPWTVTGRVLAGHPGEIHPLPTGAAVEIGTGAPVPANADAVLPYEHSHCDGPTVTGTIGRQRHIRRTGDDTRPGDLIVPAGRIVTATIAAAAVQAGTEDVLTHQPPTVTLLVTGDEIIAAGTPGPGQVRDSFTGLVHAITHRAGGLLSASSLLRDDPALLHTALDDADTDVVVVSGSSSAGAADHLHTVLNTEKATWHVRSVACRPGHPQALACLPDGRFVISLPGNPHAGLVAALTLLEPLLRTLSGRPVGPLPTTEVTGTATPVPGGVRIVPVRIDGATARIIAGTGSAGLRAAAAADALAVLPPRWTSGDRAATLTPA